MAAAAATTTRTKTAAAALVLLLAAAMAIAQSPEAGTAAAAEEEEAAALRGALRWLRQRRDPRDGAWGNHTAAAVLALQLAAAAPPQVEPAAPSGNRSRGAQRWASPANPEGLLSVKQMELELVLHLWRHHEAPITSGKLAQYTLALNAVCKDPKKFYGHDLINMLQHHEADLDYEFAFSSLAVCSSGTHVRKRQIRRLLDIADRVNDHNVDTLSMVLLALKCIVREHRNRNLDQYIRRPAAGLAQQQQPDGSFVGSLHSTALAMQALEAGEESENESLGGNWNRSAAAAFLRSRQGADGAFVDVPTTAEVALALGPHSLGQVRDAAGCPAPPAVKFLPPVIPPALAPKAAHHHHHHKHVSTGSAKSNGSTPSAGTNSSDSGTTAPSNSSETYKGAADGTTGFTTTTTTSTSSSATTSSTTTTSSSTTSTATTTSANANNASVSPASIFGSNINLTTLESLAGMGKQPDLVKVTYSIWVHSNISESYNLTVQAERNTTFYNVMLLAAQDDSHYHFEATEWPNGHYVHTLAGFKEEPTSYYFWLLYQTAEMPDPANPPGNQLITPVGVDGLLIDEGNHFLFWYKKL
ncbi:hypothetical protein R5R35_000032 [Gryllus longicercus]|uniref:Uncharacterized protein n=1 Tax=Gryllus longicercus TaxID=2509291 RepID=A0AAN9VX89_9ORTH